jgi:hypothetical protein
VVESSGTVVKSSSATRNMFAACMSVAKSTPDREQNGSGRHLSESARRGRPGRLEVADQRIRT